MAEPRLLQPAAAARVTRSALPWLGAALALGCFTPRVDYRPQIALGASPDPLPLRIEFRELADASPAAERSDPMFGGNSVSSSRALGGVALQSALSAALLTSLRSDRVFEEIAPKPATVDLVLSGTIHHFAGGCRTDVYMLGSLISSFLPFSSYITLFGVPLISSGGDIDLELTLASPTAEPVASYRTRRSFRDWDSIYGVPCLDIAVRMNRELEATLAELRQQLDVNRAALLRWRRVPPAP